MEIRFVTFNWISTVLVAENLTTKLCLNNKPEKLLVSKKNLDNKPEKLLSSKKKIND